MAYGEVRLTRYELGQISKMHDEAHYRCIDRKDLAKQLEMIGLPARTSRFDLAQRLREIEANRGRL